jgi:hypothetical protein
MIGNTHAYLLKMMFHDTVKQDRANDNGIAVANFLGLKSRKN